jgi:hypothetical protein
MALFTHGFLTVELIELAYYPSRSPTGRRSPSSSAHDRLRQFWLWGYLDRVELPVSRQAGRRPLLYTLGSRGIPLVEAQRPPGNFRVQRRRLDRLAGLVDEHDLHLATFWAHLMALLGTTRITDLRWIPERELRARRLRVRDPQSGNWLPVLPDAYIELEYPGDLVQCSFLEVDLGTLTLARFRRKLRAFEAYLAHGGFTRDWDWNEFEVLVLTVSASRLGHLWEVARLEVPQSRWDWYQFATLKVLNCETFGAGEWVTLNNEFVGLLYYDAFESVGKANDREREP